MAIRELNEILKLDIKKKSGKGRFKVVEFTDNGHFVTYIPSLNLSASGQNKEEARKMMGDLILKDFFENLLELPESRVYDELQVLGWKRNKFFKHDLSKDVHIDREGILKNFNLSEETKLEEYLVEA